MSELYIKLSNGLKKLTNVVTQQQIEQALGYLPASKSEIMNIFHDDSEDFIIADGKNNVIAKINKDGIFTTDISAHSNGSFHSLLNHISNYSNPHGVNKVPGWPA